MKKQRSIDQIKALQAQNYELRRRMAAGERRRRAAVGEIIDLNRRMGELVEDRAAILVSHQATVAGMVRRFGTETAPGVWELTYLPAGPADLDAYRMEAEATAAGEVTARVIRKGPEDEERR